MLITRKRILDLTPSFLLDLKPILNRKKLLFLTGTFLFASLFQLLHFIIEFSALYKVGLPFHNILFHLSVVSVGAIFGLFFFSKWDPFKVTLISVLTGTSSIMLLILAQEPQMVILLLIIAGFNIGVSSPLCFSMFAMFFKNPEVSGRTVYSSMIGIALLTLIFTLLHKIVQEFDSLEFLQVAYLLIVILITLVTLSLGREALEVPPRREPLHEYFLNREIIPLRLLTYLCFNGFFYTNIYYAAVLLLQTFLSNQNVIISLCEFNIWLWVVCILISYPIGLAYDTFGRRWAICIGIFIAAVTMFIIIYLIQFQLILTKYEVLVVFFPVLISIGLTAYYGAFFLLMKELGPTQKEDFLHINNHMLLIVTSIGMSCGVLLNELLREALLAQSFLDPSVMFILYFGGVILLFRLDEPLPPKSEIEWRDKLEALLVLNKGGVPLYHQLFDGATIEDDATWDVALLGGAITGIASITKEVIDTYTSRETKNLTKIVKREDYSIMLEEGDKIIVAVLVREELRNIRTRIIDFIHRFEFSFNEYLGKNQIVSPTEFIAATLLVKEIFGSKAKHIS